MLSRVGIDALLGVVVGVWFIAVGIAKLPAGPTGGGRRAVAASRPAIRIVRRVRGVAEIVCGLAVLAGVAAGLLGLPLPFPGLAFGLALGGLSAWTAVEAALQRRWARLAMALVSFVLAIFYAGFRP